MPLSDAGDSFLGDSQDWQSCEILVQMPKAGRSLRLVQMPHRWQKLDFSADQGKRSDLAQIRAQEIIRDYEDREDHRVQEIARSRGKRS